MFLHGIICVGSICACLCYLLVFRGVTAPVSFTNLEKSLAKSAPARCNLRAGPLFCSAAGQLYNAQTCRRIRTGCSSDDALSKPGIFVLIHKALSVKSRQAGRGVTQTRRQQAVRVNHERSFPMRNHSMPDTMRCAVGVPASCRHT